MNIADLRRAARRRLPNVVFDYLDGGAEAEFTLRDNIAAFEDVSFLPKYAVKTSSVDLSTRLAGIDVSLPLLLAPIGYSRLMHPRGELAGAAGAARAGTGYILSTLSGHALENVARENANSFCQLYLIGGRGPSERLLDRAQRAGFKGLFVTIDTPVAGLREKDQRNGMRELMGKRFLPKLPYAPNVLSHPGWLLAWMADGGMPVLPNAVDAKGPIPATDVAAALESAQVTWDDLKWIRESWRGPIFVKGVHTADDARRSVDAGADGVVVSNHGGRQLDGVPASLRVLPSVVEAVGNSCEVLVDGGIRRGGDVVKAICLGAKGALVGRAYAYGMAAYGDAGVDRAIEILRTDIARTLRLLGCPSIKELDKSYVATRSGFALSVG